jgi:hypothetical protein
VFINDIVYRELKNNYNNKLAMPRVRQFILNYIVKLDNILYNIKLAEGTIKASKLE